MEGFLSSKKHSSVWVEDLMQNAAAKTIIQWLMQSIDCEGARIIVDGARPLNGPAAMCLAACSAK